MRVREALACGGHCPPLPVRSGVYLVYMYQVPGTARMPVITPPPPPRPISKARLRYDRGSANIEEGGSGNISLTAFFFWTRRPVFAASSGCGATEASKMGAHSRGRMIRILKVYLMRLKPVARSSTPPPPRCSFSAVLRLTRYAFRGAHRWLFPPFRSS